MQDAHHVPQEDRGRKYVKITLIEPRSSGFHVFSKVKLPRLGLPFIGRKATEILPGIENSDFDWIGTYGKVALEGNSISFEEYSEPLNRRYDVTDYSDEPGYFATVFCDIKGTGQIRGKYTLRICHCS